MFPVNRVTWPSTWMNDEEVENKENEAIQKLDTLLKTPTVAVILEPLVQGAGGMNIVRTQFIKKVTEIIKNNNSLLIADEVLTLSLIHISEPTRPY